MKIELTGKLGEGFFAIIDADDEERLSKYCWTRKKSLSNGQGWAVSKRYGRSRYMSRIVMGVTDPDMRVKYINGDTLDNRKRNLLVTLTKTSKKRKKIEEQEAKKARREAVRLRKNPTEAISARKYAGVVSRVIKGVRLFLGELDHFFVKLTTLPTSDKLQAARAYDCMMFQVSGAFCRFHFPEEPFEEKWERIGEEQRRHILKMIEKKGL